LSFILVALIVTMVAWMARLGWRRFKMWRFLFEPGIDADKPIIADSYRGMRRLVTKTRCPCGGKMWDVGEGPDDEPNRYRVTSECTQCHAVYRWHFDISKIPN